MDRISMAALVFDKNASSYESKYMDVSLYADMLNLFCDNIKKQDAHILDMACGPGNVTKFILDRHPAFNLLGIDLAPGMIEIARKNNPKAQFKLMDCRDVASLNKKYDGVACSFCLPYVSREDMAKLFHDIAKILEQGGLLYISTMEDDYGKSGLYTSSAGDSLYIYYHEGDNLVDALQSSGFAILDLQRKLYEADEKATTDLVIVAQKR